MRARKRREWYESQITVLSENQSDAERVEALAAEEERERVRQVLRAMDSRQARLLLLRYSEMSYKEIAIAVGISANSVGTLLARAEREFEKRYREREE